MAPLSLKSMFSSSNKRRDEFVSDEKGDWWVHYGSVGGIISGQLTGGSRIRSLWTTVGTNQCRSRHDPMSRVMLKLRKGSPLDDVMPTQVEKLMISRVRVMTHGLAMLRSWKNEVVSPTDSWEPKQCDIQMNKTNCLLHPKKQRGSNGQSMVQNVTTDVTLPGFQF